MRVRLLGIAARNLLRHRRRTVVSGLAVAFGVTALLIIAGVSQGFLEYLAAEIVEGRLGAIQVHRAGYVRAGQALPLALDLPDDAAFRARLRAAEGVRAVSARLVFGAQVSDGRRQAQVAVRGVDALEEAQVCPRAKDLPAGGGALLGGGLAAALGQGPGAMLTLSATGPSGRANALDVALEGTVGGLYAWDTGRVATVPLRLAQALTGMPGRVTEYAVAVAPGEAPEEVAARLERALGADAEVHTWAELTPILVDVLFYLRWMVVFAAVLLAVVVAAGIGNVMTMSVYERTREIGTQLAIGMRRRDIARLFLLEALVLGLLAALAGLAFGVALVSAVGALGVPSQYFGFGAGGVVRPAVDAVVAQLGAAGAVVTTVVAAVLPARRAARLAPADALRGRGQ